MKNEGDSQMEASNVPIKQNILLAQKMLFEASRQMKQFVIGNDKKIRKLTHQIEKNNIIN